MRAGRQESSFALDADCWTDPYRSCSWSIKLEFTTIKLDQAASEASHPECPPEKMPVSMGKVEFLEESAAQYDCKPAGDACAKS